MTKLLESALPDRIFDIRSGRVFVREGTDGAILRHRTEAEYDELIVTAASCPKKDDAVVVGPLADLLRVSEYIADDSILLPLAWGSRKIANIDVLLAEVNRTTSELQRLVIVEDKLRRNSEQRREVLGQLLEYGNVLGRIDVQDIEEKLEPVPSLKAWLDDNLEALGEALKAQDFLLVICADRVHPRLVRLIDQFKSRIGLDTGELCLVSMAIYSDDAGKEEILVPNLVGGVVVGDRDLTVRVEVKLPEGHEDFAVTTSVAETPEDETSPRRKKAAQQTEEQFLSEWTEQHGKQELQHYDQVAQAIKGAGLPGFEISHTQKGAPTFGLAGSIIGPLAVLRVGSSAPVMRDSLYRKAAAWEADPSAAKARMALRQALESFPGAAKAKAMGGQRGRVSVPLQALAANPEKLVKALQEFAAAVKASE